jgi:hypothetical protein
VDGKLNFTPRQSKLGEYLVAIDSIGSTISNKVYGPNIGRRAPIASSLVEALEVIDRWLAPDYLILRPGERMIVYISCRDAAQSGTLVPYLSSTLRGKRSRWVC